MQIIRNSTNKKRLTTDDEKNLLDVEMKERDVEISIKLRLT
jgi:hypothetical protein